MDHPSLEDSPKHRNSPRITNGQRFLRQQETPLASDDEGRSAWFTDFRCRLCRQHDYGLSAVIAVPSLSPSGSVLSSSL